MPNKEVTLSQNELIQFLMNQSNGALCKRRLNTLLTEKRITDVLVKQLKSMIDKNKINKIYNSDLFSNALNSFPNDGVSSFPL